MMKSHITIKLILPVLLIVVLYSCETGPWNCLNGNGIPEKETRNLDHFNGFVSEGAFDILLIPDTIYSVKIEADQNLLPYIRTRVSGSRLIIDTGTRHCLSSSSPMLLTIKVPSLNYMNLTGSGQITGDNLSADRLRVELTGSGEIDLREIDVAYLDALITGSGELAFEGGAGTTDFQITGSGNLDAFQLESDTCMASISGSGSMYVRVESRLEASISGSGNIFYKGNPDIKVDISGSGAVSSSN